MLIRAHTLVNRAGCGLFFLIMGVQPAIWKRKRRVFLAGKAGRP